MVRPLSAEQGTCPGFGFGGGDGVDQVGAGRSAIGVPVAVALHVDPQADRLHARWERSQLVGVLIAVLDVDPQVRSRQRRPLDRAGLDGRRIGRGGFAGEDEAAEQVAVDRDAVGELGGEPLGHHGAVECAAGLSGRSHSFDEWSAWGPQ
ncbi:hypothetical protein [Rhodococcus ruber]|uniref:hypothetical protein n=1 Tax=Rhodococcus ruber TaxID=1830 RepID=UPI001F24E4C3|nr:hypothetical protein [Rhodococcus ruber]